MQTEPLPARKQVFLNVASEERELAFNLITNLVLKAERPALLVLITRTPVRRTFKHNRNTGDRIAVHEPFLETNSGDKDFNGLLWLFIFI